MLKRHHVLRALAERALDGAAGHQVEELVGAANLQIGLEGVGVVALHERVEELVQADRLALGVAQRKVLALQHLRHGEVWREVDDVLEAQLAQPIAVVAPLHLVDVEDTADLLPCSWPYSRRSPAPSSMRRAASLSEASPICAVKSPITRQMVWPSCWNWRSLRSATARPICRRGPVGSMPSLTRSFSPARRRFSRSSRTITSTTPRVSNSSISSRLAHGAHGRAWRSD